MQGELNFEELNGLIAKEEYTFNGNQTTCTLTLKNGFIISEVSECHDPRRYSITLGMEFARKKAMDKLTEMYVFHLCMVSPDFRKEAKPRSVSDLVREVQETSNTKSVFRNEYNYVASLTKFVREDIAVEEISKITQCIIEGSINVPQHLAIKFVIELLDAVKDMYKNK